jgi:hypothetical protein
MTCGATSPSGRKGCEDQETGEEKAQRMLVLTLLC